MNMNYVFCFLLLLIILYCCLGTKSIYEGMETATENQATKEAITEPSPSNSSSQVDVKVPQTPLSNNTLSKNLSGVNTQQNQQTSEVKQYQQELDNEGVGCSNYDENGYCIDNNAKNKKDSPGNYNSKKKCDDAGFIWNKALKICQKNFPGKDGSGTYEDCPENMIWDSDKQTCTYSCPPGMHWNHKKKKCEHSNKDKCPSGKKWNSKKGKCVKDSSDSESSSGSDSDSGSDFEDEMKDNWNKFTSNLSNFFGNNSNQSNQSNQSYPDYAVKRRHEIPPGDEHLYILKSEIVPPVCPACPPVISGSCNNNAKCPPCPPPQPIPPCPPCERCPEPQFQCKKVPDYRNIIPGNLPRPLLNDFSQFT